MNVQGFTRALLRTAHLKGAVQSSAIVNHVLNVKGENNSS